MSESSAVGSNIISKQVTLKNCSKAEVNEERARIEFGRDVQEVVNACLKKLDFFMDGVSEFGDTFETRMKRVSELAGKIVELDSQNDELVGKLSHLVHANDALVGRLEALGDSHAKFDEDFRLIKENIAKEESQFSKKAEQLAKLNSSLEGATASKAKIMSKNQQMYTAIVISAPVVLGLSVMSYYYWPFIFQQGSYLFGRLGSARDTGLHAP